MTGRSRRVEDLSRRLSIDPDDLAPAAATPAPAQHAVDPAEWSSTLDDPAIIAGRHGYRSFYVDDAPFARFRSAVFWLSRREDAADVVPPNMSVAIEQYMLATAVELENRFNGGQPFRATPDQVRTARQRQGK